MPGKGESQPGARLHQHGTITAIGIVGGDEIRQSISVEFNGAGHEFVQVLPELFLGKESIAPTGDAYDAKVRRMSAVVVNRSRELGPIRVDNPARDDVYLVPRIDHSHGHFLHIHQLPSEIGVLGQVRALCPGASG